MFLFYRLKYLIENTPPKYTRHQWFVEWIVNNQHQFRQWYFATQ